MHKSAVADISFTMKSNFDGYVGVIDSGVGGLTVLRALQRDFPQCSFVYLADSAYCPYGVRHPREILCRVQMLVRFLQHSGVQSVVIACNTASVYADTLRAKFLVPIYDVIAPTCLRVADVTLSKRVALLATNATVASGAYQRRLAERDIAVVAFACSSFVPFVEANRVDTCACDQAFNRTLASLPICNVDTVVLGCTHFPIMRKKIAPFAHGAKIVECCTDFTPQSSVAIVTPAETLFLTTGVASQANEAAHWFGNVNFLHVDI